MVMVQMLKNGMQPVQKSAVDFFFLQILGEGCFSTVRFMRSEFTMYSILYVATILSLQVYRAREVSSGKEFALKVLNKDLIRRHDKVLV